MGNLTSESSPELKFVNVPATESFATVRSIATNAAIELVEADPDMPGVVIISRIDGDERSDDGDR